jgi:organic radical activating enzyme
MLKSMKKFFNPEKKGELIIEPGIYQYQATDNSMPNHRFHLRVEQDGNGILILDASTVLHLNKTAAQFAYFFVKGNTAEEAASMINVHYQTSNKQVLNDFMQFEDQIFTLLQTPDLDPVISFGYQSKLQFTETFTAPYRLDLALTYEVQNESPDYGRLHKRVDKELSTDEWKSIIDKSWAFGIPQVIFTGGEPTLRQDLAELIQHAENNGQVTGLITNGYKLADQDYLNTLLQAGLDHTMIVLEPKNEQSWDSLSSFNYWKGVLDEDLFVSAHLTISKDNKNDINEIIAKLANTDISALSISETGSEFTEILEEARELIAELNIDLVWDLPVPYSNLNPVSLELNRSKEVTEKQGGGKAWLYVEPDGDVLPEQDVNKSLGNINLSEWVSIWEKAKSMK